MSLTPRSPVRRFSQPYATPAEAWASKAGGLPGAEVRPFMGGWRVVKPPKPAPRRRPRRDTGFSARTRLQCRTRAGNGDPDQARCEATGVWLGRYGGEIQHREARGMGGSSDPARNSLVNAVLLSTGAHRLAESRDRGMNEGGFWLRSGQDPARTPIRLHSEHGPGITVWLAPDGIGDTGTGYLYSCPRPSGVLLEAGERS